MSDFSPVDRELLSRTLQNCVVNAIGREREEPADFCTISDSCILVGIANQPSNAKVSSESTSSHVCNTSL